MQKSFDDPAAVIEHVAKELVAEFEQRGHRLIPLSQADVAAVVARADALLQAIAHCEHDRGTRLTQKVARDKAYINHVGLAGDLIDAINSRRSSTKGGNCEQP